MENGTSRWRSLARGEDPCVAAEMVRGDVLRHVDLLSVDLVLKGGVRYK